MKQADFTPQSIFELLSLLKGQTVDKDNTCIIQLMHGTMQLEEYTNEYK